ncbi:MAG: hypothetical protein ACQEUH_01685 [Pseudomonadota bacterium]
MKGIGVLYMTLGASTLCAGLAIFGHVAGWPIWGLVVLWLLAVPVASALAGMIAGLLRPWR